MNIHKPIEKPLCDSQNFINCVKDSKYKFNLSQFKRINDYTISWMDQKNCDMADRLFIFIMLDYDDCDREIFRLGLRYGNSYIFSEKFDNPYMAVNYLNLAADIVRARKHKCDSSWLKYGF